MTLKPTPIPAAEKLQMMKADKPAFLAGDNTALAESLERAIQLLERNIALIEERRKQE
ncbi:hypothetical protein [Hyphomonas sp.]|uniref:hypothetical protein n=1 Tax=Hyphomonas sp. TaxID=87 RepID=UPI0025C13791|nr:hypothetical protein [Hyphomonas sp.]